MYSLSSSHAAQRKSCLDIGVLGAQREMVLATRVSVPGKDCAAAALLETTRVRKLSKIKKNNSKKHKTF